MPDWRAIEADLEGILETAGFELVQLEVTTGRGARLVVLADVSATPGSLNLDDCAAISRLLAAYLDQADPFAGPYRLLVSSPGVDRPLTKLAHCQRSVGQQVKVRFRRDGRPATITGRLEAVAAETLQVAVDGEMLTVDWSEIEKANVVYRWDDDEPPASRGRKDEHSGTAATTRT
ncbi:MAG: ribosome maturation factor RimP [Fimbriimonadaceae bacterium]|nr:ribosome maturation factor RimP [Fimbriimonadaceae bacterium]